MTLVMVLAILGITQATSANMADDFNSAIAYDLDYTREFLGTEIQTQDALPLHRELSGDDDHAGHKHGELMENKWVKTGLAVAVIATSNIIIAVLIGPKFKDESGNWDPCMLRFLYIMLGFASGVLTGDAAMHLIPHGFEKLEELKKKGDSHRILAEKELTEHEKHELYRNIGLVISLGMFS